MTYMKTVDGVDYISTEERDVCSCVDCIAQSNRQLCEKLNEHPWQDYINTCLDLNIIWITKEEEK